MTCVSLRRNIPLRLFLSIKRYYEQCICYSLLLLRHIYILFWQSSFCYVDTNFFLKAGYSSEIIGLAIGVHRFAGLGASVWIGPRIDQFNSKTVVILTEIVAAFSSVCLIASWMYRETLGLNVFCFFIGTRAATIGVQTFSRNRLVKVLSEENQSTEASMTIWLNKVTQGAHAISALVAIPLVASGNLSTAIVIDGLSFLVGGFSAISLPDLDSAGNRNYKPNNFIKSLSSMVKLHKYIFIQDLLLALVVSGTILLMVKLSADRGPESVIYFNLIFGSCIWISSFFAHKINLRNKTTSYWILILFGFILLSLVYNTPWRYLAYFITYLGYWILYHKYTVEIQTKTPKATIGATMATRWIVILFVLSVGELLGGYFSRIVSVQGELGIRAFICALVILWMIFLKKKLKSL